MTAMPISDLEQTTYDRQRAVRQMVDATRALPPRTDVPLVPVPFETRMESPSEGEIEPMNDVIQIPLSSGNVVLIDANDEPLVSQYHWYEIHAGRQATYARCDVGGRRNRKVIYLHRLLLDPPPGMMVDHINRNGLDNRRSNLRLCTNAQNQRNTGPNSSNTSGFKGVARCKQTGKWLAHIRIDGAQVRLGRFPTKVDAARAYDEAARVHHGAYAGLNFDRGDVVARSDVPLIPIPVPDLPASHVWDSLTPKPRCLTCMQVKPLDGFTQSEKELKRNPMLRYKAYRTCDECREGTP